MAPKNGSSIMVELNKPPTMEEPRMAESLCRGDARSNGPQGSESLAAGLHASNRWRLGRLLSAILFVQGRRTVTLPFEPPTSGTPAKTTLIS